VRKRGCIDIESYGDAYMHIYIHTHSHTDVEIHIYTHTHTLAHRLTAGTGGAQGGVGRGGHGGQDVVVHGEGDKECEGHEPHQEEEEGLGVEGGRCVCV
jgi:hypothetical protein